VPFGRYTATALSLLLFTKAIPRALLFLDLLIFLMKFNSSPTERVIRRDSHVDADLRLLKMWEIRRGAWSRWTCRFSSVRLDKVPNESSCDARYTYAVVLSVTLLRRLPSEDSMRRHWWCVAGFSPLVSAFAKIWIPDVDTTLVAVLFPALNATYCVVRICTLLGNGCVFYGFASRLYK
jgi:hypothetical protein